MLAFIELVPPLVATTLIPACDFPAGHVGVNFDVGVGVVSGGGVGGLAGGGGGGGGDGGGGAGAAFFMAVAEFQPGDIWTTSHGISSDLRDQPLGMCIWRAIFSRACRVRVAAPFGPSSGFFSCVCSLF